MIGALQSKKNILVTGGAGFIGSHLIKLLVDKYPKYRIICFDKLTYAGNLENLAEIENAENYKFVKGDICSEENVAKVFHEEAVTDVIHLAAESHVDRSISNPSQFIETNVLGTTTLLNEAKKSWSSAENLFYHVSTDEVFGSLGKEGFFNEETSYDPKSPYSASKAASDHIVRAYGHTFDLSYVISNCSNNYGANQFPEKLIPLVVNNINNSKPIPVYGTGDNVRDWLWVGDHARAIDEIFHKGKRGETYCVGGENEWSNLDLVKLLIQLTDKHLGRKEGSSLGLIKFVTDRAGHDFRYAINSRKLMEELSWKPSLTPEEGMSQTVSWYLENPEWLSRVTNGAYMDYYNEQYLKR